MVKELRKRLKKITDPVSGHPDHERKINETNKTILALQRLAEQRRKSINPSNKSLTEEFFKGLKIL